MRDAVLLNAAAALVALEDATGQGEGDLPQRFARGWATAAAAVDDGRAADLLRRWVAATA